MANRIRFPMPYIPIVPMPHHAVPPKFLDQVEDNAMTVKRGHPHAELMKQYAEDAAETNVPWERWEVFVGHEGEWRTCGGHPRWFDVAEYRRKPQTISINGHEVPKPIQKELETGQKYFYVETSSMHLVCRNPMTWQGDNIDRRLLRRGLIHLTREAAYTHAKALLSFTHD